MSGGGGLGSGWGERGEWGGCGRWGGGGGGDPFGVCGSGVCKDVAAGCGFGPGEGVVDVGGGVQADAAVAFSAAVFGAP